MWAGNFLNNMTSMLKKKLVRHAYKISTMGCQMHWGPTRNASVGVQYTLIVIWWNEQHTRKRSLGSTGYGVRGPITWQAILLLPTYWDLVIVNFRRDCRRCALDVHTRSLRSKRQQSEQRGEYSIWMQKGWFVTFDSCSPRHLRYSLIRDLCSASSVGQCHVIK